MKYFAYLTWINFALGTTFLALDPFGARNDTFIDLYRAFNGLLMALGSWGWTRVLPAESRARKAAFGLLAFHVAWALGEACSRQSGWIGEPYDSILVNLAALVGMAFSFFLLEEKHFGRLGRTFAVLGIFGAVLDAEKVMFTAILISVFGIWATYVKYRLFMNLHNGVEPLSATAPIRQKPFAFECPPLIEGQKSTPILSA